MNRGVGRSGFTLIEMAVVLVIIGLLVGGILVGRDLVRASEMRAQISQIEKYNTAANTFRGKYGYLPGDIKDPDASSFGFQARGSLPGQGDGNGVIEGLYYPTNVTQGIQEIEGETSTFWVDLSTAGLIDGGFTAASITSHPNANPTVSTWFPAAKIGGGNFVYVWSGGMGNPAGVDGNNYYGVSVVSSVGPNFGGITSTQGLTVQQAYGLDLKVDDGLPRSGNITAMYLANPLPQWAAGGGAFGASGTGATPGSSITCYDNANSAGAIQQYSIKQSGGRNINCAVSFRFQ